MISIGELRSLLERYGVRPSKSRGQNYLIDRRVAEREVEYLDIAENDRVLEVGPGFGILTSALLERTSKLTAIEIEEGAVRYLRDTFPQMEVVQGDFLETDPPQFDLFISNVPYSISSPLLFHLLDMKFKRAVIMVQREFAERMAAPAGDDEYSRLSVNVFYRAECKLLENVPRSRFWPEPEVDSTVVLLTPRPAPFPLRDEKHFLRLVDVLFQQRRKKIGTVLKQKRMLPDDRSGIPFLDERVERLTPAQIAELSDSLSSQS
ncbi:MAG TPA: 16S rRNA (adenine(1518)-N(6)/adenine(1519)-N(6))-dimethyltransferase RsmA [Methanomassiliicoccales archaeon]|nr:16S rRNA (adenine(1518)-N(6)/adenine(1519)-N(6))-dimethyltransferase RsmA [Methanomassiliicoccales archaeon]HPR97684.1 16S rRNA (adenine(1518)-N(6)/adenine(1519)-N(6))-dimethyltransferase RsmA [Methanomassiliicoccales archaeon]